MSARAEPSVGCVMVTHNGARHLTEQLDSMHEQTVSLDELVVIDDGSVDATTDVVRDHPITREVVTHVVPAPPRTESMPLYDRIAANFSLGVSLCGSELIVLADQDDVWYPRRVAAHVDWFRTHPQSAMVASNADLIDAESAPLGRTMRDDFPVPAEWSHWSPQHRMRYTLAKPVATGAASAIVPRRLVGHGSVPRGWLHDRWYSLDAVANNLLDIDPVAQIAYRVHSDQVLGVAGSSASRTARGRLQRRASQPTLAARKLWQLSRLALATDSRSRSAFMFPRSVPAILGREPKP
ncbi:glycosyltransferase [Flexivirga meconopsidis]|uniref:glycosyltransferase n=1 Tax=Flexivirga meconopsidis TaxID=2977121 RepID=UPI00223F51A6|nr:glycosyltransferase [Flexivirga meconopsidis]